MTLRKPQLDQIAAVAEVGPPSADGMGEPAAVVVEGDLYTGVAIRGAAWTAFGFVAKFVLRFGFNLLLTRLVAPRVFGVMALVFLLVQSLHMFSDLGLLQCVVHHRRGDDPEFLNTAWTMQAVRGLLLWILSAALAAPAAAFYGETALLWLIPLAGVTALLSGLTSTALFTLHRRLDQRRLALLDVGSYFVAMVGVVAVVWHYSREGPLTDVTVQRGQMAAFAVGSLVTGFIYLVASYWLLPGHRHRFRYEPEAGRELLHFGGWIFVSTACTFLAGQADRLVIGKLSLDVLGVYQLGSQLAALPAQLLAALCAQLIFPLYSRLLHAGGDVRPAMTGAHRTLGLLAGALTAGLIAAGPTLVECLYPGRYQDAGQFVQLLAGAAWFMMLQSSGEAVLLARGQTRLLALGQIVKLLALPGLLYFGYAWYGLTGLVIGFAMAEVLRYGLIATAVAWFGLPLYRDDARLTVLVAVSAAVVLAAESQLWGGLSAWGRLACASVALLTIWGAAAGLAWRREWIAMKSPL
jgi:O-antigen/teichoic acid export membrane protein